MVPNKHTKASLKEDEWIIKMTLIMLSISGPSALNIARHLVQNFLRVLEPT